MTKKPYSKPTVTKICLEDEEVASMAAACKTGDPTLPAAQNTSQGDCAPGGLFNGAGLIVAADACVDPATLSPCSAIGPS